VKPFAADGDAASAVVSPLRVISIAATGEHVSPRCVGLGDLAAPGGPVSAMCSFGHGAPPYRSLVSSGGPALQRRTRCAV
jgi:hypothetical protein